jgi:hypothetical protein
MINWSWVGVVIGWEMMYTMVQDWLTNWRMKCCCAWLTNRKLGGAVIDQKIGGLYGISDWDFSRWDAEIDWQRVTERSWLTINWRMSSSDGVAFGGWDLEMCWQLVDEMQWLLGNWWMRCSDCLAIGGWDCLAIGGWDAAIAWQLVDEMQCLLGSWQMRCYCAADFSLLNLPKGKSLGRSKPATNS